MPAARTPAEKDGAGAQSPIVNGRGLNMGGDQTIVQNANNGRTGARGRSKVLEGDDEIEAPEGDDNEIEDEDQYVPEGYETVSDYLQMAMRLFKFDYEADRLNLEEAAEDLRFTYVDQWDPDTRMEREAAGRPCLTINDLPQFVGQVIGDRRINKTTIKVVPARDGTVQIADTRMGLIKTIEQNSRATRVYDMVCEDQVVCGIGNFMVVLDYAYNDVFNQDIFIRPIPNPLAVIWDRMSYDPTGRDARHCFVIDTIPREEYEREWPDQPVPQSFGDIGLDLNWIDPATWIDRDTVKVVAFWQMIEKPATFAMMQDGQVEDVTGVDPQQYMYRVARDQNGEPFIREGIRPYAVRHLITSFAILDGPYELPLTRLPVIKVSGRVGRVGTQQVRFGLVRWARDPALLRNYWRSTAAETLAMAPKNQWISPASAVEGREDDFRKAHLSGDPLLIYNDGPTAPVRQDPPNLPAAVLQESQMNQQDIKDVTGLQDASLGMRSNEVSGKAIMARQREGDVATVTYHDNLNEAIQEGGDVVNQLIPLAYDTIRTIRVTGTTDKSQMVKINDPNDENSPDLTQGKYDVFVITGPSYTTQRMEAADAMMNAIQVAPQLMEVAGDLIVRAQDWPEAEEIADRLANTLPAAQQAKKPEDMTPEQQQQLAQQMEQQQQAQQLQAALAQAELEMKQAEARKMAADADKAEADAEKVRAEAAQLAAGGSSQPTDDPVVLEAQRAIALANARKADAEARKAEADAEIAEHNRTIANDNVGFNRAERTLKVNTLANPPQPANSVSQQGGRTSARSRTAPKQRKAQ